MAKIIEFPDLAAEQAAFNSKMDVIGQCQRHLAVALREMVASGADANQIIRILRHAITEIEPDQPS